MKKKKLTLKYAIFSTTASVGTPSESNISTPFTASATANLEGVLTEIVPLSCKSWQIVSCTSPVPGGISRSNKSSSPHSVPFNLKCSQSSKGHEVIKSIRVIWS